MELGEAGGESEDGNAMAKRDLIHGIPVKVDPAYIECELAALWKPASETEGGEGAVVRACLTNLVVFLPGPAERDYVAPILNEVFRSHPNRTLLLVVDDESFSGENRENRKGEESGKSRLQAFIKTLCSVQVRNSAPVCCEQITLRARPSDLQYFSGAVAPLLVPDIPFVLWWHEDYGHSLLLRLGSLADRIIVDSRKACHGCNSLQEIHKLKTREEIREVIDLGWRGLAPLRNVVAGLFDENAILSLIKDIRYLEIKVVPSNDRVTLFGQAALLSGWIASRLNWSLHTRQVGDDEVLVRFKSPSGKGGEILLTTGSRGENSILMPGEPMAVRLSTASDGSVSFVSIELDRSTAMAARVDFGTAEACRLPKIIPMPRTTDTDLLNEILNRPSHPTIYGESLKEALKIMGIS